MLVYLFSFLYNIDYDENYYDECIFKDKLKIILERNKKILHRKRNIPINVEIILNKFCILHTISSKNKINSYNYEKSLSYEITDPYIFIIENSFSIEECNEMIQNFENEPQVNGWTAGGYNPRIKRTLEVHITGNSDKKEWNYINKLCFNKLSIALKKYSEHCMIKCNNNYLLNANVIDTGYQMQKYIKETQYYDWHHDYCNNEHGSRLITFIWYLNDVNEGGETFFFNCKVKPVVGRLCLFPACWNYNHKGNTPISNDKYIITGWVYSKH